MTDLDAAALRALAYGLLQDRLKTGDLENRRALAAGMEVGDRKTVRLEGEKVGAVTYAEGATYASVTDRNALIAWLAVNRPDELVEVTTFAVRPAFEDYLLKQAKVDGAAVDAHGEAIPGIEVRQGTSTIKVVRDKGVEATAAIVDALFADNAVGFRSLLAIESSNE